MGLKDFFSSIFGGKKDEPKEQQQPKKHNKNHLPEFPAVKYQFDIEEKCWVMVRTLIKLDTTATPFAKGGMRDVFKVYEVDAGGLTKCVAKVFQPRHGPASKQTYFTEAEVQAEADTLAVDFNRECGEKKIDIKGLALSMCPCSVIVILPKDCPQEVAAENTFFSFRVSRGRGPMVFAMEVMLPEAAGVYEKYNNNSGFVCRQVPDKVVGEAARANFERCCKLANTFSHFTFERSKRQLVVVDLQGVGDWLTDPQIHSRAMTNDSAWGDFGDQGIIKWSATHRCNEFCRALELPEVARRRM